MVGDNCYPPKGAQIVHLSFIRQLAIECLHVDAIEGCWYGHPCTLPVSQRLDRHYTTSKVDGTTPSIGLSWPLTKPPFGSCAIYFHYGADSIFLVMCMECGLVWFCWKKGVAGQM